MLSEGNRKRNDGNNRSRQRSTNTKNNKKTTKRQQKNAVDTGLKLPKKIYEGQKNVRNRAVCIEQNSCSFRFFPPMVQTSKTVLKPLLETLTARIARETIVVSLCVFYWFSSNCILKGQDGLHFGFA